MSVLGDVRGIIADALKAETTATVSEFVPGRLVPPLMIITPNSPYIESGDTFGSFKTHFSIEVVSPTASNDTNTEALDVLIEDALVSIVNAGILLESVSRPYSLEANNATYLAASISVTYQTAI